MRNCMSYTTHVVLLWCCGWEKTEMLTHVYWKNVLEHSYLERNGMIMLKQM